MHDILSHCHPDNVAVINVDSADEFAHAKNPKELKEAENLLYA